MATKRLLLSIRSKDTYSVVQALLSLPEFKSAPIDLTVDDSESPPLSDWMNHWGYQPVEKLHLNWSKPPVWLIWERKNLVKCAICVPNTLESIFDLLETMDFQDAVLGSMHEQWSHGDSLYLGPILGPHYRLGLACAFKGTGHDRVLSRRFLEYGPWRLHHRPRDLSIVQFHELHANADAAIEQARFGHERMELGHIEDFRSIGDELTGSYVASERLWRVDVDEELDDSELLEAVYVMRAQPFGPEKTVERVAYVFTNEELAKAHVHEIWIRGFETWVLTGQELKRLDVGYVPRREWLNQPGTTP